MYRLPQKEQMGWLQHWLFHSTVSSETTQKSKEQIFNRGLVVWMTVYHLGYIPQLCSIPPSAKKPFLVVQTASAIKHLRHVTAAAMTT